ncbi:hypothetical protein [Pasteuria penetrans]|uniref:hypothetical protein n=1 Tax=Pasteuria penetrans TaxID=86005 RepID=UPI000F9D3048|nr:hypothetical protein [Pasteuria penetrans]
MTGRIKETTRIEKVYEDLDKKLRAKGFFPIGTAARALGEDPRTVRIWVEAFFTYVDAYWDDHARLWLQETSMDPLRNIQYHLRKSHSPPTLRELRALLVWEGKIAHEARTVAQRKTAPSPTEAKQDAVNIREMQHFMQSTQKYMENIHNRLDKTEEHMVKICDTIEELSSHLTAHRRDERVIKRLQKFFDEVRKWQTQMRTEIKDIHFKQQFASSLPLPSPRRQQRNRPKFLGIF